MIIGKNIETNGNVVLDLQRLIATRMLINANSGAGKSWLGRRMMEQCSNQVQQLVIDLEGEFVSLREKHDFLIVGKGGDIPISIKTAELLATKLLDKKISAVMDLSELKKHERHLFVRRFLESLMEAPGKLQHQLLLYVDEAHQFAPEGKSGKAECKPAMVDLATRGRKRGFCGVFMTQRISKFDKDLAAELNNSMTGRTTLDIDRKRAGNNLGFTTGVQERALRELPDGVYHSFGPAFAHTGIVKVKVGPVFTTHPDRTKGVIIKPSKTPANISKVLKNLIDLPKESEIELRTLQEHKAKIFELKREIRVAKLQTPTVSIAEVNTHLAVIKKLDKQLEQQNLVIQNFQERESQITKILRSKVPLLGTIPYKIQLAGIPNKRAQAEETPKPIYVADTPGSNNFVDISELKVTSGALRLLKAAAAFSTNSVTKHRMCTLSGLSHKSGTVNHYLYTLKKKGLIVENGKHVFTATEEGIKLAGDVEPIPADSVSLIRMWTNILKSGPRKMFPVIAQAYPDSVTKEELGDSTGLSFTTGTFNHYLYELRKNGLVTVLGNEITAAKELFEE